MRALGFEVKKNEVLQMVHLIDPQNEGVIGFDLYLRLMAERYGDRDPMAEVMKAFALFDAEGVGKISVKNLKTIARELGETLSDDEIQAMIDEFDGDQDGEVTTEEFIEIMTQSAAY